MSTSSLLAVPTTRPTVSFELYPPRRPELGEVVWQRILRLAESGPDFFSVTYGASGSSRDASERLVRRILDETGVPVIAHLTCVGTTREELGALVRRLLGLGVRDFLALRGDPPAGQSVWAPAAGGLARSSELAALREKQAAGADFAITQVFYDVDSYASLVADARAAGVLIPILPGIIPLTDPGRLARLGELTGVDVPPALTALLAVDDETERLRRGVAATVDLVEGALAAGAPGLHLYTFNRDRPALDVLEALRERGVSNPALPPALRGDPARPGALPLERR